MKTCFILIHESVSQFKTFLKDIIIIKVWLSTFPLFDSVEKSQSINRTLISLKNTTKSLVCNFLFFFPLENIFSFTDWHEAGLKYLFAVALQVAGGWASPQQRIAAATGGSQWCPLLSRYSWLYVVWGQPTTPAVPWEAAQGAWSQLVEKRVAT